MTNPLVVEAEDEDAEPLDSLEGAGVASSWADLATALDEDQQDLLQVAFTAAGAGLDTLGAIADPFDAILSSAIGWVIEHVWFLHEPLDALAGDPQQIVAQAQTWHNVSRALGEVAADYRGKVAQTPGWDGAAGDGYRAAVGTCTRALDGVAAQAEQLSGLILGTGAAVGTVRALIRDLIAEFLSWAISCGLAALATTVVTGGGSVAAFVVGVVAEAVALAQRIARRVSRLLDALSEAGGTAGQVVDGMRYAASEVRAGARPVQAAVRPTVEAWEGVPAAEVIEAGKQLTGAKLDDEVWSDTWSERPRTPSGAHAPAPGGA